MEVTNKPKIKIRNLTLGIIDQLNFRKRKVFRNIWKGHILGAFDIRSHQRESGKPKVMYNTIKSALKASNSMTKKYKRHFSVYKCIYCDGFHLGANRENKRDEQLQDNKKE